MQSTLWQEARSHDQHITLGLFPNLPAHDLLSLGLRLRGMSPLGEGGTVLTRMIYIDFDVVSVEREDTVLSTRLNADKETVQVLGECLWRIRLKPRGQTQGGMIAFLVPLDPNIKAGGTARLTFEERS
jgi:hypothetical protein